MKAKADCEHGKENKAENKAETGAETTAETGAGNTAENDVGNAGCRNGTHDGKTDVPAGNVSKKNAEGSLPVSGYGVWTETLKDLVSLALENGATDAVILPTTSIVVDERVLMKCMIPRCRHYGDLVCPPNVMTPSQFREILENYHYAVMVSTEYHNPPKPSSLVDSEEVSLKIRTKAVDLSEILLKLESLTLSKGYRFAAGLTGGSCKYCDECAGTGARCRHPYKARPSMEAVGIDVVATLRNVGIPLEFPVTKTVKWWGILLVDRYGRLRCVFHPGMR
ncbi:MAG: DUF2284 domain-containing protein [Methanosarcinaceae archaeon]|nr:DUF2284 domain-containing protein [Methanosarcinaceae archaeon]